MAVTIKLKRDTAANWTSNNPTLAAGEMGIETDTNKFKFGDGSTAWTSLSYSSGSSYSDSDVSTFLNGNIDGHLIPDTNITYDLGSPEKKFRYLYLDSSTMFLGDTPFSASNVDHSMEVYVDQPAPVSSTAEGKRGDVRVVDGYMYVCVDTNTWVRSAVETNW